MREVERKAVIRAYLKYVVSRAEYLFKCKFTKIHVTSPVRLKEQFLNMFQDIFTIKIREEVEKKKISMQWKCLHLCDREERFANTILWKMIIRET